jgi:hypothetical protein
VALRSIGPCSPFVRVATGDNGTAVYPAVKPSGGGNGAQPTADTSRANEDDSVIGTGSTVIGNARLRLP